MGGEVFPKVSAGDPLRISAETWNALMAMGHGERAGNPVPNATVVGGELPPGVIWIKNESGADRDEFDILGISGILISPTDNEAEFLYTPGVVGVTPTDPAHAGKWAVLLEPIADGQIGKARIFGIVSVLMTVNAESDTAAEIINNDATKLQSRPIGSAKILWKEAGTGAKQALIYFPVFSGVHRLVGKLVGDLDCNSVSNTATMNVWDWDGSGYGQSSPLRTVTVRPTFASRLGKILAGMKVEAEYYEGIGWCVVAGGKASWIVAVPTAAFTTGDSEFTGDIADYIEGEDPGSSVTVVNTGAIFYGDDQSTVIAFYDPEQDKYDAANVSCPSPSSS